jgi:hypothetical protein
MTAQVAMHNPEEVQTALQTGEEEQMEVRF